MKDQEVYIKDVEAIAEFKQKFGDFYQSFEEHIHQFTVALRQHIEKLEDVKQQIRREREQLDDDISNAYNVYRDSYNYGSYQTYYNPDGSSHSEFIPDYSYIAECRREYEHLSGNLYHQAQSCEGLAHSKLMQSHTYVNLIEQRIASAQHLIQTYVERGSKYLSNVEQAINEYKERSIN
jgi:hypothetical protein